MFSSLASLLMFTATAMHPCSFPTYYLNHYTQYKHIKFQTATSIYPFMNISLCLLRADKQMDIGSAQSFKCATYTAQNYTWFEQARILT